MNVLSTTRKDHLEEGDDDSSSMSSDGRTPVNGPDEEDETFPLIPSCSGGAHDDNEGTNRKTTPNNNNKCHSYPSSFSSSSASRKKNDSKQPPFPTDHHDEMEQQQTEFRRCERWFRSMSQYNVTTTSNEQPHRIIDEDETSSVSELTSTTFETTVLLHTTRMIWPSLTPITGGCSSPCSSTGKRRRPAPRKVVHFDETQNQEHEDRMRTVEDFHETWYKDEEYESFVATYGLHHHHHHLVVDERLGTAFCCIHSALCKGFTMDDMAQFLCCVLVGCCSVVTRL